MAAPTIEVQIAPGKFIKVTPHPVHNKDAGIIGQVFYGSFTLVTTDGEVYPSEEIKTWNPTKTDHTEPQYYNWVGPEIVTARNALIQKGKQIAAVIYEVNQTNTPCSHASCRPAILTTWLAAHGGTLTIARMSAFQMYESEPPKVQLTSVGYDTLKKKGTTVPQIAQNAVVHVIPKKM